MPEYKQFGGERFRLVGVHHYKSEADSHAVNLRREGKKARVTKDYGRAKMKYAVWSRG